MSVQIVYADITKLSVDAIVVTTNESLVSTTQDIAHKIQQAAGPDLLSACRTKKNCLPGSARILESFALPCKHLIHVVAPQWQGGHQDEENILKEGYTKALNVAVVAHYQRLAFPLPALDSFGMPAKLAQDLTIQTISTFFDRTEQDFEVLLVFPERKQEGQSKIQKEIDAYLSSQKIVSPAFIAGASSLPGDLLFSYLRGGVAGVALGSTLRFTDALNRIKDKLKDSFATDLLKRIKKAGISEVDCYRKANVDKTVFSRIRSNPDYKPKKTMALAFAIALEMSIEETKDFLSRAGYALSPSDEGDMIVSYCIEHSIYDIEEINQALFQRNHKMLGSKY